MIVLAIDVRVILLGLIIFLAVMLALVSLLLYIKKKLTPAGDIKVTINEETEVLAEPGSSLLSALGNNKIFLPSACGGGGTCGMCKCQVLEGGGTILPTETGFFTDRKSVV